ncbi:FAD-dependent oxidoreductase [Streptomyces fuscigenes]|uniref:FAD-dependent oxidoreductase n=1 Tax=Streptomyces fuscigenes TaxID=1528880 RepID=UPI001F3C9939|nr:FAD-dependent monooxygenase [Streptomyces fuscigenes]MCF3962400.1 FAD-dependent monooxygenase [Streptomyces fuscigenes]
MNENVEHQVPVLIVGGSLVGLSAALFLGRLGVEHMVVEKHAATSTHPRGRGNNVRTMELFRTAGVEQAIKDAASVLADNHGILQAPSLAGEEQEWLFKEIDPGGGLARFSPTGWCLCSQNDLEPVLVDSVRANGTDLRFSTELMSFEQDSDGVTAVTKNRETGEHTTVRAQYLVAADGPRSPVREALGIDLTGAGELFHNVSVTFRSRRLAGVVGDRRFIVCYLTNPRADGALLPVDNEEKWVFHLPWHPDRGETLEDFTDERCAEHIRAAVGDPGLDVEITGRAPWHAAERVARRYADGRVLLAGDSVHEMSPTGAFGSNTGIQDAHNLAWKLAAVLAGHAGPGLLETYEAERLPVAEATSQRASSRSAEHSHPGYEPAPSQGGPGSPSGPGGPKGGGMLPVVLAYRYPRGAVLGAEPQQPVVPQGMRLAGDPGSRAPHLWVRRAGERLSTLDLYERSLVLVTGEEGGAWREAARDVARRMSVPLDVYEVGAGSGADLVTEEGADWAAAHGTTGEGAVLVRPDGFVAWRETGGVPDPARTLADVLGAVLRRD